MDWIPLPLAAKLLPFKSRFRLGLAVHLFLHVGMAKKYNGKKISTVNRRFTIAYLENITSNLYDTVNSLTWKPEGTEWAGYYDKSVGGAYFAEKQKLVRGFFLQMHLGPVLDLGANDGTFSQIAKEYSRSVLSFDIDPRV